MTSISQAIDLAILYMKHSGQIFCKTDRPWQVQHNLTWNSCFLFWLHTIVRLLLTCIKLNTQSCWTQICPAFANSVDIDPDQLASEEANWSGSALFAI